MWGRAVKLKYRASKYLQCKTTKTLPVNLEKVIIVFKRSLTHIWSFLEVKFWQDDFYFVFCSFF